MNKSIQLLVACTAMLFFIGCANDSSPANKSQSLSSNAEPIMPDTAIDGSQAEQFGQLKITSGVGEASVINQKLSLKPGKDTNGGGNSSNSPVQNNTDTTKGKPAPEQIDFDKIIIKVSEISVSTLEGGWQTISSITQTLDLIRLSQNATIMLADHRLPPGTYSQIRLKLDGNAIGLSGDLETAIRVPSGAQTGLKLNAPFVIQKGFMTEINLTFDPNKSIHITGNGKYMMKPVIKVNGMQEDLVAPTLAIVNPTATVTNIASQTLRVEYEDTYLKVESLSITDNGSEIKSQLAVGDAAAEATLTLSEGVHKFEAKISDMAPNWSTASHEIMVDLTAPFLMLTNATIETNNATVEISAIANDNLSGLDLNEMHFYLDGVLSDDAFVAKGASILLRKVIPEGMHQYKISIQDIAGNYSEKNGTILVDLTPPSLSVLTPIPGVKLYANRWPLAVPVRVSSSEIIYNSKIANLSAIQDFDNLGFSQNASILHDGMNQIIVEAVDKVGNIGTASLNVEVVFDNVAPQVAITIPAEFITKQTTVTIPVEVTELNVAWTAIYVNDEKMFETQSKDFESPVFPLLEGENEFKVISTDEAGNISIPVITKITRDTIAPKVIEQSPDNGGFVAGLQIPIDILTDEKLASAKVNGVSIPLGENKSRVIASFTGVKAGPLDLNIELVDLVGNSTNLTFTVNIILSPLIPSLISVSVDEKNNLLYINGAIGSTRPGMIVKANVGYFISKSVTSGVDGSFQIEMEPFTSATVSAYDSTTKTTTSTTVNFGDSTGTVLAGAIRDTNNQPLVGVSITIFATSTTVKTNADGVFKFTTSATGGQLVTGDQILVVDGTTTSLSGPSDIRRFNRVMVPITIGLSQNNVMQRPIYLAPLLMDGNETNISASSPATVVNEELAPGVQLEIPAGVAQFPNGSTTGAISIQEIPANVTTVPPFVGARPKTVIALEPSGTTFLQPVSITLPNKNNFPPKTDMVVLLMNSKTGRWEIGGVGQVDDSGQSIVSKPGQGIKHFSLAYATVLSPDVRQLGAKDKPGADTFDGAMTTKIELPSFMSLGKAISPVLQYNSSWAKPSAFVTNIIDAPTKQLNISEKTAIGGFKYQSLGIKRCVGVTLFGLKLEKCFDSPEGYFQFVQYDKTVEGTATYTPKRLTAFFQVADFSTLLPPFTGLLEQTVVSFGLDLKSSNSEYVSSGIYPYRAHYELEYEELIVGTVEVKEKGSLGPPMISQPIETPEARELAKVFPPDLGGSIYVQNYVNSPAGRGWRIGGVQTILPPSGNRVAIEEADGSILTFNTNDTIETVYDVGTQGGGSLDNGVGLNTWPKIQFFNSNATQAYEVNLANNNAKSNLGSMYSMSGRIEGFDFVNFDDPYWYSWTTNNYYLGVYNGKTTHGEMRYNPISLCQRDASTFSFNSKPTHLYVATDGAMYGTDPARSSLFRMSGGASKFFKGIKRPVSRVGNSYTNATPDDVPSMISSYCGPKSINCVQVPGALQGWTSQNHNSCGTVPASTGEYTISGYQQEGRWSLSRGWYNVQLDGINNPTAIIPDPASSTSVIVADSGANVVRRVGLWEGEDTSIVAGNRTTLDSGDGNYATGAGIFHPRGLVFDNAGNLYISTENGYIRKVGTNGVISTFAGKGKNQGSIADDILATEIKLVQPYGMIIDHQRNYLYVADTGQNRIVRIDLITKLAKTVAGGNGTGGAGDNGLALKAQLNAPTHLWLDSQGNLIIADTGNNRIRRVNFQESTSGTLALVPTTGEAFPKLVRKGDLTWEKLYRDGTKIFFNKFGQQTSSIDRVGRQVVISYDQYKRVTSIKDPVNQQITFSYSGDKLQSITDPAGRVTSFLFTNDGQLSEVIFPDDQIKKFEYTAEGLLQKETNQRGVSTIYTYNKYNRLEKATKADGSEVSIADGGSKSTIEDSGNGDVASAIKLKDAENVVTDANGNPSKIGKDNQGYIYTVTDAEGKVTSFERDLKGRTTKIIRPDGTYFTNTFDQNTGDLLKVVDSRTGENITSLFDSYGNEISHKDSRGFYYTKTFDPSNGLLIKESRPGNRITTFTYKNNGVLGLIASKSVSVDSSTALVTTFDYDSKGNLVKQINPGNVEIQYKYDLAGNQIEKIEKKSNTETISTKYQFDMFNRLTKVTTPKNETTEYLYLGDGKLSEVVDPNKNSTKYSYSEVGKLTGKTEVDGSQYLFEHDGNGNRTKEIDPNGNIKTYKYNYVNRIIEINLPDDTIFYTYNDEMKVTKVESSISKLNFGFDAKGRISSSKEQGQGELNNYPVVELGFSYDLNDNRTQLTSMYGNLDYNFDDLNRLETLTNMSGQIFSFTHDDADRIKSVTRPGSKSEFNYGPNGFINSIVHSANGATRSSFGYSFDTRNLISQKNSSILGAYNYSFDDNGQLQNSNNVTRGSESFSIDAVGNLLGNGNVFDVKAMHLMEDVNFVYRFDQNGNLIKKISKTSNGGSVEYDYSSLNQLKEVRIKDSGDIIQMQIKYHYNALGHRLQKTVTNMVNPTKSYTRKFAYDNEDVLFEFDGDNKLLAKYTHSSEDDDDVLSVDVTADGVAAGLASRSGSFMYMKDHLNSVTDVLDSTGKLEQSVEYSVFGKVNAIRDSQGGDITAAPVLNTSYLFTGREYESETGMYYYRARYYDPSIGRFMQKDPDPGNKMEPITVINKHAYVGNNPVMMRDPSGMRFTVAPNVHGEYCGETSQGYSKNPKTGDYFRDKDGDRVPNLESPVDGLDEVCKTHDAAWKNAMNGKALDANDWKDAFLSDVNLFTSSLDYMVKSGNVGDKFTGLKMAVFSVAAGAVSSTMTIFSFFANMNESLGELIGNIF